MKLKLFSLSLLSIILLFSTLNLHVRAQSDDDLCDPAAVQSLLLEMKEAIENDSNTEVEELLEEAIAQFEVLSTNCRIEPLETGTDNLGTDVETSDVMTSPKDDGFYLVGIDIAPGKWESTGNGDACYWKRADVDGETTDNHFGNAGGTVTIQDTDFQVEFNDCGTFMYVENREPELAEDANEPKEDGFYTIGVEIAPGLWRSTGSGDACYYARLDEEQDTIDNHYGNAGITVNLHSTDFEVAFDGCGTWEYLGEP